MRIGDQPLHCRACTLGRDEGQHGQHGQPHEQPWNDRRQEQLRDRHLGDDPEQHQPDRRRNDDRQCRACADQPRGMGAGIAVLLHALDDHRADGGDRCGPRSADRAPEQADDRAHHAHAAGQAAHKNAKEPDHPFRDSGRAHQRACQDEERDGQQRIARDPRGDQIACQFQPKAHLPHRIERRQTQRERHRHAQRQQQEEQHDHLRAGTDVRHDPPPPA